VSKIRCLAARTQSDIEIEIHLSEDADRKTLWRYALGFTQTGGGVFEPRARLKYEKVWAGENKLILNRPGDEDKKDDKLLEYTHLEQPTSNAGFREIAAFLEAIQYMHVVPQLLRDPTSFLKANNQEDYYGRDLIERINKMNANTRDANLRKIQSALLNAVPQFQKLELIKDEMGIPHLQTIYQHWRAKGAKQWEDQFSDGTLRFIGFFWALLDGNKPILFEEPELSLHSGIVSRLAEIIAKLQKKKSGKRQVILTTHSHDLLSNHGINGEEVLMLTPKSEGTEVKNINSIRDIVALLKAGMSVGDIVIPKTTPKDISQISFPF
ncbi:MAG: AAA family ATPase, partial [bacterium]